MYIKHEVMLFIGTLIVCNTIDFIMCKNKRIKIYVPEHIRHVHHHHVKKVPVYIVTKDRPRVMHASHIEDGLDGDDGGTQGRRAPRTRAADPVGRHRHRHRHRHHYDYDDDDDDDDIPIRGVFRGDESHVHEDIDSGGGGGGDAEMLYATTVQPAQQAGSMAVAAQGDGSQGGRIEIPYAAWRYNAVQPFQRPYNYARHGRQTAYDERDDLGRPAAV